MSRNVWIAGALAAVLVGFGVVVGRETTCGGAGAPAAAPAGTPAPEAAGPGAPENPGLLGVRDEGAAGDLPCCDALTARLARLEAAVGRLAERQEAVGKDLAAAGEVLDFFKRNIPEFRTARAQANQTAAHATMRNVTSAQAQIQATGRIDADGDGTGEYGGFREMSGAVPGRMARLLVPPVLSSAFKQLDDEGAAARSGYLYRFYLPGPSGEGIGEPRDGFDRSTGIDTDLAETTWCCYAWPIDAEKEGGVVFFVNQAGDVLTTVDMGYSGPGRGPSADAAFLRAGSITGPTAVGTRGSDGNTWTNGLPRRR